MLSKCNFLHNNIAVEILVVTLTLASGLAITGENLITFKLITVPQSVRAPSIVNNTNISSYNGSYITIENIYVIHILHQVFQYSSLGIAALFFVEIVLKCCTLKKRFISKPWQIFDTVVVLATLSVELTFHFVHFNEQTIYSVTYIVMLRLWRVPVLCKIRGNEMKDPTESNTELYTYRKGNVDEKYIWMEDILSPQAKTIKKHEGTLKNLKAAQQNNVPGSTSNNNTNGHIILRSSGAFDGQNEPNLLDSINMISESYQKNNQNESLQELQKRFTDTLNKERKDILDKSVSNIHVPYNDKIQHNNEDIKEQHSNERYSMKTSAKYAELGIEDEPDGVLAENKSLPPAASSHNLVLSTFQSNYIPWRLRMRRSSTSELIDYSSLSSPNREFMFNEVTQKYASFPNLDLENENETSSKTVHSFQNSDIFTPSVIEKNLSSGSYCGSEISTLGLRESKMSSARNRIRRLSCPEYVYAQRMSITSDESMFIEDNHSIHDHVDYDSLGLDYDCKLDVLAEFDGTKTYRNKDGIPMTSL